MKIAVHDYSGHPFQIQLSRELAIRGHDIWHIYSASYLTPHGRLTHNEDDPDNLKILSVDIDKPIRKGAFIERWLLEKQYGTNLVHKVESLQPELVLSANTPLDAQRRLLTFCKKADIRFIFWVQDLIGEATRRILRKKLPLLGNIISRYYIKMENNLLLKSDHIIGITDDFIAYFKKAGLPLDKCSIIPNWATLEEIRPVDKANPWAAKHGLEDKFVFLYSGTLGFKHNPVLLLELARRFVPEPDIRIVVNSEGEAADWLRSQAEHEGLVNLIINTFQPYEHMSDVMGTADVLVAILEKDAGYFSVPSKVLTYHCAGKPLLLAVPFENLSSRIVRENETGLVSDPVDISSFITNATVLVKDKNLRDIMSEKALEYSTRHFDIEMIADKFERIMTGTAADT